MIKGINKNSIASKSFIKNSTKKNIKGKLVDLYQKSDKDIFETIFSKDNNITLVKFHDKINLLTNNEIPLFFSFGLGTQYPSLKLIHIYPSIVEKVIVDIGATLSILSGSDVMAPGLLWPEYNLPNDLQKDQIVAIYVHGRECAIAVGKMLMSSEEITKERKGHSIENLHHLGDSLWNFDTNKL